MSGIKRMLSRKVFRRYMASFLLAFVLPLALLAGVMCSMLQSMARDQQMNTQLILRQFSSEADGQLYSVMRSGDNLLVNEKVIYFSTIADPSEYKTSEACFGMLRSLMQDVSTLVNSSSDIESAYLTFTNSRTVIGSSYMDYERFFARTLKSKFATLDEWQNFLACTQRGFVRRGSAGVSYLRTSTRGDVKLVLDIAIGDIITHQMLRVLPGACGVYSQDGQLLYASAADLPQQMPDAVRQSGEGEEEQRFSGTVTHLAWCTGDNTSLRYVIAIPARIYHQRMELMRLLSVLALMMLLVGGVYLAYALAKRRYEPIEQLSTIVQPTNESMDSLRNRDDFAYLQDILSGMQDEKHHIRQRLRANNQSMEHFVLEQLMRGTYTSIKSVEEQLLSLDIVFDSNLFAVLALRIDTLPPPDAPTDDAAKLEEDRQLTRFVVHNIFEELLASFSPLVLEMSNRIYILLSPGHEDDWSTPLLAQIDHGCEVLRQHYETELSFALSDRAEGMHNIAGAYATVREALGRKQRGVHALVWQQRCGRTTGDQLQRSAENAAHKLEQILAVGDEAALEKELAALGQQCAGQSPWNIRMALTALLNAACKPYLGKLDPQLNAELQRRLRTFLENAPAADDMEQTKAMLLLLCRAQGSHASESDRGNELEQTACSYIRRHYMENNLNVSMVADQLGLTPSYASALFKRQVGRSMLDYINAIRIAKAKELLTSTRLGLEEVAEQTGYYNASTFIRVFKKYEGITPGQYRGLQGGTEASS